MRPICLFNINTVQNVQFDVEEKGTLFLIGLSFDVIVYQNVIEPVWIELSLIQRYPWIKENSMT